MEGRKTLSLLWKIAIGFAAGMALGFIIGPMAGATPVIKDFILPFLDVIGKIFLSLLKMLIVPLVFSSLVVGAASIGNPRALGRIGVKTLLLYICTTAVAIALGLLLGNLVQPGVGLNIAGAAGEARAAEPISDVILNIFPSNPLKALVDGNMLQVIVFALFLGVAGALIGEKGKLFIKFNESLAEIMYKVTGIVMTFAHKSPKWFFSGVKEAMLAAFVTRTSSGVLPISMRNVQQNLGVSEKVSSFVLPLGATINMDGTALYQGVCVLFIAQAYGIPLSFSAQMGVLLTATLASIGTAGVPGSGVIMLSMVLASANLPIEGIGLVAVTYNIMSTFRGTSAELTKPRSRKWVYI